MGGLFLRLLLNRGHLFVGLLLYSVIQPFDRRHHQIRRQAGLSGLGPVVMSGFPLFQQGRDGAFAAGAQHMTHRIDRDRLLLLRQLESGSNGGV